jgi:hypothetical protein
MVDFVDRWSFSASRSRLAARRRAHPAAANDGAITNAPDAETRRATPTRTNLSPGKT